MKTNMKINLKHLTFMILGLGLGMLAMSTQVNAQTQISDITNTIFIPNSFTPNGDGTNDEFMAYSEFVKRYSLRIFDDQGQEVYATTFMDQGWDGKHYNREMSQTVYLYRVEVEYLDDTHEVIVGHLNLIR